MTQTDQLDQTEAQTLEPTQTGLAKPWVARMVIILIVLIGFGGWGFYDAVIKYPAKGREVAQSMKLEYLHQASLAGRLFDTSVADPVSELKELRSRDLLDLSAFDRAKRDWLEALAVPGLGMLDAEHTQIRDAQQELRDLTEHFKTRNMNAKLSHYDILMQWVILVICWGFAIVISLFMVAVASKKFRWDPRTKTLTLPNGKTVSPADLDPENPADLTKWHKFIIFLRPRDGSALGTSPIKIDLFRYALLEDWIRELVKAADGEFVFPDEQDEDEDDAEDAEGAEGAESDEGDETDDGHADAESAVESASEKT